MCISNRQKDYMGTETGLTTVCDFGDPSQMKAIILDWRCHLQKSPVTNLGSSKAGSSGLVGCMI